MRLTVILFAAAALASAPLYAQDAPPATATDTGSTIVLDNGLISLTIAKKNNPAGRNGEGISIKYEENGRETELSNGRRALYFDVGGDRIYPVDTGDGRIVSSDPDLAEVEWITEPHAVTPAGRGFGGGRGREGATTRPSAPANGGRTQQFPFDSEFHVLMPRGARGFYLYAVYRHDATMARGNIGESRFVLFGARGTTVFTNHIVDDQRMGPFTTSPPVRTLQDVTTLRRDRSIYTKYNNSAYNFDHHVHGLAGHGLGLWMIFPSNEFIGGGPFKQELTVHAENALLAMLIGGHFGTQGLSFGAGERWSKVYGPVFVYCNHTDAPGDDGIKALWTDAKRQASEEEAKWPYRWLKNPDYPLERGTVRGHVSLSDGASAQGAWAILSPPEEKWTQVLKGYDYWAQVDADGNYRIAGVRPGTYRLCFVGANQFEEFDKENVAVAAGDNAVADLIWPALKHGRQLWQIGVADRLTFEFKDGDQRHYEGYIRYLKAFPDDVNFVIGKSKQKQDWYYAQFAIYNKRPYWTIQFDSPSALSGKATLTLGFASADPHNTGATNSYGVTALTGLLVKVNGTQVAAVRLPKTGTAGYRSGTSDSNYNVAYVTFDASLIKAGTNQITLGHADEIKAPADPLTIPVPASVMYDAIRLEVDAGAAAPAGGAP